MKKWLLLLLLTLAASVCVSSATLSQQTPGPQTPGPHLHAGPLYHVPGQLLPIDPATGQLVFPPDLQAKFDAIEKAGKLADKGGNEATGGDWTDAVADYQQALSLDPNEGSALYGLGDYSLIKGYTQAALGYYRQAIYTHPDPPALPQIRAGNAFRLMEFALLLSQTGQQDEALTVYRHAKQMFRINLKMPLPDFGDGPGQVPFTPPRLQAMAQVGWAYDYGDFKPTEAGARLQQAIALDPDSPVPYFYRALHEIRHGQDYKAALVDLDKAEQLGDGADADAVEQERHFYRYWLDWAAQTSPAPKATP
jgi:tetratricopeptide (TPR) repeat protein